MPAIFLDHAKTGWHDLNLPLGRPVAHVINAGDSVAQPGLQVRTIRRQRRENETAINFHARHGFHMEIGVAQAEAGVVIATLNWDMAHLAIQFELPGVITAGKDAARVA